MADQADQADNYLDSMRFIESRLGMHATSLRSLALSFKHVGQAEIAADLRATAEDLDTIAVELSNAVSTKVYEDFVNSRKMSDSIFAGIMADVIGLPPTPGTTT